MDHRMANSDENARLDIKADNFWNMDRQSVLFDIRVFNPLAFLTGTKSLPCATANKRKDVHMIRGEGARDRTRKFHFPSLLSLRKNDPQLESSTRSWPP